MGKPNGVSFIRFNTISLKAILQKTNDYLQELHLKCDIIAVSETWAELDVIDVLNLIEKKTKQREYSSSFYAVHA